MSMSSSWKSTRENVTLAENRQQRPLHPCVAGRSRAKTFNLDQHKYAIFSPNLDPLTFTYLNCNTQVTGGIQWKKIATF